MTAPDALQQAIRALAGGQSLSGDQATAAFDRIMNGEATPVQVAGLLMALRVKGETPDEVAGAARALRGAMVVLDADLPDTLVDTCGTGGGSVTTFNISTGAALLAAGLGVRVAKHGNRSFTSQCGSADVLEALGVPLDVPPERMAATLRDAGIVFMFAPSMHPAMRHVGPVRRELAVPTVMNIVGPLANPARAGRQVLGVADRGRLALLAGALAALGTEHALVVHGEPGLDEISPLGKTLVLEIRSGVVREWMIDPDSVGVTGVRPEDLAGGTAAVNAEIITRTLAAEGNPGATAAVVMNAAAALYVAGLAASYEDGVRMAREGISSKAGLQALDRMRAAYAA
jgi:anthranilate phosphoribosyltransferase